MKSGVPLDCCFNFVVHCAMAIKASYLISGLMFPAGIYVPSRGIPLPEDGHELPELPRTDLPAPQLVMLANVALTSEPSPGEYSVEEKQMVELKNVACSSYSDSEDENVVRYSFDNSETSENTYLEDDAPVQKESGPAEQVVEKATVKDNETSAKDPSKPSPSSPSERPALGKRKQNQVIVPAASAEPPKKKKKPFYCKPCQFQAECEEEFIHHIRTHSAKKLIVVNGMGESDDETTNDTAKQQTPENGAACTKGVIRCERCGYNTNRYDHYMAHLRHHKNEGDDQRVFKCTICPYSTVSQYHWKKHLRNHFPSKLFTCNQCSYFSDRKNNYIQHIRTHTGERPFQCIYCDYSSSQKTHLTRHMRTHSGERPFKCDSCSYLAANQHEVTRHARQVHNGPKPLSCPYCQYKTADRSNFKKHVELHVNPRQFLCPVCKYAASKKCNLQYHIKSRHPGCSDISMDVSKVRLRVKKADGEECGSPVGGKQDEAARQRDGRLETTSDTDSCGPINLSIKKSSRPSSAGTENTKKAADVPGREKSGRINHTYEKKAEKKAAEKKNGQKNEGKEVNNKKAKSKALEKTDATQKENTSSADKQEGKKDKELKKVEKAPKSMEKIFRSYSRKEKTVKDDSVKETVTRDHTAIEEKRGQDMDNRQENERPERPTKGKEQKQIEECLWKESRPQLEIEGSKREKESTKESRKATPKKSAKKQARVAKSDHGKKQVQSQETSDNGKKKTAKRKAQNTDSPQTVSTAQDGLPEMAKRRKVTDADKPSTSTAHTATTSAEVKASKNKGKQSRRSANKSEMSMVQPDVPTQDDFVGEQPKTSQVEKSLSSGPQRKPEQPTLQEDLEEPTSKQQLKKPALQQQLDKPTLQQPQPGKPTLEQQQLEKPTLQQQKLEKSTLQKKLEKPVLQQQELEKLTLQQQLPEKPVVQQQQLEKSTLQQRTLEKSTLQQQTLEKSTLQKKLEKSTLQKKLEKSTLQKKLERSTLQKKLDKSTLQQQKLEKPTLQKNVEKPALEMQQLEKPTVQEQHPEKPVVQQQQLEKPTVQQKLDRPIVQQHIEKPAVSQELEKSASQSSTTENNDTGHCSIDKKSVATEEEPKIRELVQGPSENTSAEEELSEASKEKVTPKENKVIGAAQKASEVDIGSDEIPSPTESDGDPGFSQEPVVESPSLELPGPTCSKPTDAEDDEGIHSHDGGSDISDCASEGSYDSGLNGLANAGEKLPETPTEELPSPTQLLSHTCVFCDRTFPLEMDYRRHLNRHLVNVYYLESATQGDK
ncbi:hypothetical protein NFI96_008028 [Prochilodus magdalenae]|nr:hypothetical protein NFI96_008028 [Prochilodus magdalenae]